MNLEYRHELKHFISPSDRIELRQRLSAVMKKDSHAKDGVYTIRSLYFDNVQDKALMEKVNGNCKREKFRIRYYDGNTDFIRLEKKSKINNLCNKQSEVITKEEVTKLLNANLDWMITSERPLIKELYTKMLGQGLKPKTIVEYVREPFTFLAGNVRVTIDYNLRTSTDIKDFLEWNCLTVPVVDAPIILEVKWDEFIPDIIRDIVQLEDRQTGTFSKYVACRVYG